MVANRKKINKNKMKPLGFDPPGEWGGGVSGVCVCVEGGVVLRRGWG